MLSGGASAVFLVIFCAYASSLHTDRKHDLQDNEFYDDYFPRRDTRSVDKSNSNYKRLLNYRGYGQEPQATIIVALIRPNETNNSTTNNIQNKAIAYIDDTERPIWLRDYEDNYDEYDDEEENSSTDDSLEDYENPHRRQESGQYLYKYQSKPSFRTRHRTKHMWVHPLAEKYSSNVVGYTIKVKHPSLNSDQFNNDKPSYHELKSHNTNSLQKPISYYDGSLESKEKIKEIILNFKNGFKDQDDYFNQANNYKSQSIVPSEVSKIKYSFPKQKFTIDDSNESPSDIETLTSSSDFMALLNPLKSNQFIQLDSSHSGTNYNLNYQNSDVSNDEVPLRQFMYNKPQRETSYDIEDEALYDSSENIKQDQSDNEAKIKTITFTENIPFPVKVEKQVPVPIKIPVEKPFPIFITKPVPVRVHKPVPVPVKVPVPKPYPVQKIVPVPVKVPVPRSFPVPVNKPYPVYYFRKVPFAVFKPRFYPIKIPVEKPVPYAVTYNKYVPLPIIKNVPVPFKVPKYEDKIKVEVEFEKPYSKPLEELKTYADNFKHGQPSNIKLPLHIPLDKVKEINYFHNHDEEDYDQPFDKETIAFFGRDQYREALKPDKNNYKEINDHNTNEPITFYGYNRYHNPKTTFTSNNEFNKMTAALFDDNGSPKNIDKLNSMKELDEHSSHNEELYNEMEKTHFSMDFYPEDALTFSTGQEDHSHSIPKNTRNRSQWTHKKQKKQPEWTDQEEEGQSEWSPKQPEVESQWTPKEPEEYSQWSHKEPEKHSYIFLRTKKDPTYTYDEDMDDHSYEFSKKTKLHSHSISKESDEKSHSVPKKTKHHSYSFPREIENYSYDEEKDEHAFSNPQKTKENTSKDDSELTQKNKAYPSDYKDSKNNYVVKDFLTRVRSKELKKDKGESNEVLEDTEKHSLTPFENELKPNLHYQDILRVKSIRPSLQTIKITKFNSRQKSKFPDEDRNSSFADSNLELSSSNNKVRVWRGSKKYIPEDPFDDEYYDGRRYDSPSSSLYESFAYKSGESKVSDEKMSKKITSEMKINSDKEEVDSKSRDGTRSSEALSSTRQSWSNNHSQRRNRHAYKETPRENTTIPSL